MIAGCPFPLLALLVVGRTISMISNSDLIILKPTG
jgi:hypothetical protein